MKKCGWCGESYIEPEEEISEDLCPICERLLDYADELHREAMEALDEENLLKVSILDKKGNSPIVSGVIENAK